MMIQPIDNVFSKFQHLFDNLMDFRIGDYSRRIIIGDVPLPSAGIKISNSLLF